MLEFFIIEVIRMGEPINKIYRHSHEIDSSRRKGLFKFSINPYFYTSVYPAFFRDALV